MSIPDFQITPLGAAIDAVQSEANLSGAYLSGLFVSNFSGANRPRLHGCDCVCEIGVGKRADRQGHEQGETMKKKPPTERQLFTKACRLARELNMSFRIEYDVELRFWFPGVRYGGIRSWNYDEGCSTKTQAIASIVRELQSRIAENEL